MTDKPVPTPTPESAPFWTAARDEGRLAYQSCLNCARAQHYPRALCGHCGGKQLEWRQSSGRAVVYAATRVHIGLPSFKAEAPYDIVLVDVEEGFRMVLNVIGNPEDIAIGDAGRVVLRERDGTVLPQFERS